MSSDGVKKPDTGQKEVFGEIYDEKVACPWCDSHNTCVVSPFGGTVSEISMKCNDCQSSFGWMKWEGKLPGD
ncbi:MAG: hypothetical protein AB8B81_01215 [Halioglobus sp.]